MSYQAGMTDQGVSLYLDVPCLLVKKLAAMGIHFKIIRWVENYFERNFLSNPSIEGIEKIGAP